MLNQSPHQENSFGYFFPISRFSSKNYFSSYLEERISLHDMVVGLPFDNLHVYDLFIYYYYFLYCSQQNLTNVVLFIHFAHIIISYNILFIVTL